MHWSAFRLEALTCLYRSKLRYSQRRTQAELFQKKISIHRLNQLCYFLFGICARIFLPSLWLTKMKMPWGRTPGPERSFVSLPTAVFCVACELISENRTPHCVAC